jgi:hypothetical protein
MAVSNQSKRQQFLITEAFITSDRNPEQRDMTQYIGEFVVYEDLNKPYITAKIAFLDDRGIFSNELGFKGTETFTITVQNVDPVNTVEFTHSFLMTSIEKMYKTNEKTEVYVFNLIDKHVFLDANIRLSKSYKGKIENIITAISVSELGKTVDQSYISGPSLQDNLKVIIPYLSPLQACQWLTKRATTKNGSPFFFYASLYDENLRIGDFDGQYSKTPFNSQVPLTYSPAATNDTVDGDPIYESLAIKDVKYGALQDTLKMITDGAVGSRLTAVDVSKNVKLSTHHSIRKTLARLQQDEVIPSNSTQNVFDPKQVFVADDNSPLYTDDANAREFYKVHSFGTYNSFNSYEDVATLGDTGDILRSLSVRSMLEKNRLEINIPGTLLLTRKVTVGDTIAVNFLSSNVVIEETAPEDKLDRERSGNYLIYAIRHTFTKTTHDVVLSITKLNTKPGDAPQ